MAIMLLYSPMEPLEQEKLTRTLLILITINRMLGTEDNPGIMFQTLKELFNKMRDFKIDRQYNIRVSFLEIYNE